MLSKFHFLTYQIRHFRVPVNLRLLEKAQSSSIKPLHFAVTSHIIWKSTTESLLSTSSGRSISG
ncbi:Uncharacterized protein BM_BM970 [Brugia malayi]|uniref:Bm613 n=1 Tax=Brugia malayi TaxID=6279 RepID=A0A1P6CGH8_BRUMA|nr:Uncharacterized protein BM_BM970 [Brugia malayi]CDP99148.1 Bm613 [Brugia malayi]VIO91244.1 Uncharacterized protein BM_BM970 [Brugia malayi]